MKSFADLKANARSALLGRYSVLIGAGILAWLIAALLEIPFSRMLQEGFYYIHIFRVIWAYAGMLFVGLIGALFNIGITHMHMESARDIRPQFSDLLYSFRNRPDKFIGCELILILISFVCTLPGSCCFRDCSIALSRPDIAGTQFSADHRIDSAGYRFRCPAHTWSGFFPGCLPAPRYIRITGYWKHFAKVFA